MERHVPALPHAFFCRPAQVVAPELIGCRLVKRQTDGSLLWGVVVETEAYSQDDPTPLRQSDELRDISRIPP